MTVGIEIPIVAVVHKTLRRHLALSGLPRLTCKMFEVKALALYQRVGDQLKILTRHLALRHRQNPNT